ncbi:restriction endonuclease PLD domain-containing protein [Microbacterium sp. NPDC057407]|uniref:restriction endonuclease PLD domain-containing protein n=1 Tax=Microbacterium sp. NPDC057407 TaxID=3346120 RepID=UPI00366E5C00
MSTDLIRDDLFQQVLLSPLGDGADELHVLAGYASASFAMFHILEAREHLKRDFSIRLNIGMTGSDGLPLRAHQAYVAAASAVSGAWLRVAYAPTGVSDHSKLYVWLRSGIPIKAWFGSANYSATAFGIDGTRRETMVAIDAASAWQMLQSAAIEFVPADGADVFSQVEIYEVLEQEVRSRVTAAKPVTHAELTGRPQISLPLVQRTKNPGEVHNAGAGLNWGQRGNRRRAEAYIPVPATVARSGYFPNRGIPFAVHADDGATLFLTVAQDGDKALHSVPDNADIGLWFRRRLGLPGDAFVSTRDLHRYGATEAVFTALDDGSYFLSF